METDLNFWLQLSLLLLHRPRRRYGGVGLGAAAASASAFWCFSSASSEFSARFNHSHYCGRHRLHIDSAGAGGLDWMVKIAERMLRRWPKAITFVAPFVCSFFVIFVGTAYVAFAVYPVVAEVATQARVRPSVRLRLQSSLRALRGGFADERRNCCAGGVAFALQRVAS